MVGKSIWIGFDPREAAGYAVARASMRARSPRFTSINGVNLALLRERGLYTRPTERRDGRLWDVISEAPMSTEFAISRFLVPHLAETGWALFVDGDVMARDELAPLFAVADPSKAVMVVQHNHAPTSTTKMDGQLQTVYPRKNWSSVMLFNCDHPANRQLTPDFVNRLPGRDLHAFCWLQDHEIGALSPRWNYLVGHTSCDVINPAIVHFTDGIPTMPGYENCEFSSEFFAHLNSWAY